jgi:hypothetical protein
MLATFTKSQLASAGPHDLSDALENGKSSVSRVPRRAPRAEDLEFLRQEMPKHLSSKNISLPPEADKIIGIKGERRSSSGPADPEGAERPGSRRS